MALSDYQMRQMQETGQVVVNRGQTLAEALDGIYTLGFDLHEVEFAESVLIQMLTRPIDGAKLDESTNP